MGDRPPRRRNRATRNRPAGSTGSGPLVAALAVGGLAFGVIRGQANEWADTAAWIAIAIGVVALVAFPILMARRPHPLVPLELFRSRAFASVNLATFFIYGGLYVTFFYQAVILQGVLGYTALGAGLIGLPSGIMLALLSTRIGTLAGRIGSRRFLIAGPLLMAAGLLWSRRLPGGLGAVEGVDRRPGEPHPAARHVIDILPYALLFGLGISLVVAPLTSTLMGSISGRFSGVGSAINNSISRVGQPLLGALSSSRSAPPTTPRWLGATGLDTTDRAVRRAFQPLNPPRRGRDRRPGRRLEPGLDRGLPAGDVGVRRPVRRRRARVVVSGCASRAARRPRGRRSSPAGATEPPTAG